MANATTWVQKALQAVRCPRQVHRSVDVLSLENRLLYDAAPAALLPEHMAAAEASFALIAPLSGGESRGSHHGPVSVSRRGGNGCLCSGRPRGRCLYRHES